MDRQSRYAFLLLVVLQAAHAIEEYATGLYDIGLPGLISSLAYPPEPRIGFAWVNLAFLVFGAWCYLARVRTHHPMAIGWVSIWVIIEIFNGLAHPLLALVNGAYFPGLFTAPLILVVAIFLANKVSTAQPREVLRDAGRAATK